MSERTEGHRGLVGAYHKAWTSNDHDAFHAMLAADVVFEFPMNIKWPEGARTRLLAELVDGDEAVQIYNAAAPSGATVRIAEHLTIKGGKVARIAPIFDLESMRRFMEG